MISYFSPGNQLEPALHQRCGPFSRHRILLEGTNCSCYACEAGGEPPATSVPLASGQALRIRQFYIKWFWGGNRISGNNKVFIIIHLEE